MYFLYLGVTRAYRISVRYAHLDINKEELYPRLVGTNSSQGVDPPFPLPVLLWDCPKPRWALTFDQLVDLSDYVDLDPYQKPYD